MMIGRAAYHNPLDVLGDADRLIYKDDHSISGDVVVHRMLPYIQTHLDEGGKLAQVTRHMLGLFAGKPGARMWRRVLSEGAHRPEAGTALVLEALSHVTDNQQAAGE